MVPMLTGLLKLGQHRAHGTSLAIIALVAVAGVAGYWRAGNIDWQLVLALTPGAIAGVLVGARAMVKVPALQLRLLFGVFLLVVAFRQLVWSVSAGTPADGATGLLIEVVFGFAGGVLAGVLGVGGGAIFVPAIVVFGLAGDAGDPQKVAQGVSLVVIVFTGIAGTVTNLRQGTVDIELLRWVAPAAIIAAFLAAIGANRVDDAVLRRIYGTTAVLLGIETAYTSVQGLRSGRRAEEIEAV
ncbi:MAG: sulfite exporter TauE/SafE family protein [Chloroflexi bacterium]|nr:sulfite exporter TauE/SafE family protein [Chloroflexota bacterium]